MASNSASGYHPTIHLLIACDGFDLTYCGFMVSTPLHYTRVLSNDHDLSYDYSICGSYVGLQLS